MEQGGQATDSAAEVQQADSDLGWPEDHSDLKGTEGHRLHQQIVQARDFGKRVLTEKRELENNWKDWNGVKQKYGDPATVQQQLSQWDALYTPVTQPVMDEQGQPIIDPATGQPQVQYVADPNTGMPRITTRPFVDSLYQSEPTTVEDMMWSALSQQSANGQLLADKAFEEILRYKKIDPQVFQQWVTNGMPTEATEPVETVDAPAALESLGFAPETVAKYQKAFAAMTPDEQDNLKYLGEQGRLNALNNALVAVNQQEREAKEAQDRQMAFQQAEESFWGDLKQTYLNNVAAVKQGIHSELAQELASIYKPSDDPKLNQLHQGVVLGALSSLIHPETAFAGEQILAGLGEQVSPALKQSMGAVEMYQAQVDQLSGFQNAKIPQLYERRNAGQLRQAQEALRVSKLEVKAQFSDLMKKVVAGLGGQQMANQEALKEKLAASQSRPAFNGQAGAGSPAMPTVASRGDFVQALSSARQIK